MRPRSWSRPRLLRRQRPPRWHSAAKQTYLRFWPRHVCRRYYGGNGPPIGHLYPQKWHISNFIEKCGVISRWRPIGAEYRLLPSVANPPPQCYACNFRVIWASGCNKITVVLFFQAAATVKIWAILEHFENSRFFALVTHLFWKSKNKVNFCITDFEVFWSPFLNRWR